MVCEVFGYLFFFECSYPPSPIFIWCESFGLSMLTFWHCSPHLWQNWQNKSLSVIWNMRDFRYTTHKYLVVALIWFVKKHKCWRQQQHLLGKIVPFWSPFFDFLYLFFLHSIFEIVTCACFTYILTYIHMSFIYYYACIIYIYIQYTYKSSFIVFLTGPRFPSPRI